MLHVPLEEDHAAGDAHQAALTDYAEGTAWFGVSAVPAVIFNRRPIENNCS